MKKIILVAIGAVLLSFHAKAQHLPTTGQPFQFQTIYNPGFTGIDPFGDIRLAYRTQLGAYGANSPSFFNGLYQFRLSQPHDGSLNGLRTGTTSLQSTREMGMAHGMAVNVFDEELGIMGRKGAGLSYAFHFPVTEKLMLAVGTSAIVENLRIDSDKIYLGAGADPDPIYQQIMAGKTSNTQINVRAGAVLYSQSFYVGLSYLPVWNHNFQDASWATATSINVASLQTGVSFKVSETFDLKPSVIALLNKGNKVNLDYSLKAYFRNLVWTGLMYRDTQTGVAQLGFNINKTFSAAYSYEVSTGAWQFGSGSHELVLGIRLNNFRNLPNYVW